MNSVSIELVVNPRASAKTLRADQPGQEALAQVSFDGLPTCPTEEIISILEGKYETICKLRSPLQVLRVQDDRDGDAYIYRTANTLHAAPRSAWV